MTNARHILAIATTIAAVTINTATPAQASAHCTTPTVYTWGTKYAPCNLTPPQRLHALAVSRTQCSSWGGAWGGIIKLKDGRTTTICYNVDY